MAKIEASLQAPRNAYNFVRTDLGEKVFAMTLEGTYETKLLRLLIGYFHVSLLQQIAVVRFGKGFHLLSAEEKTSVENEVIAAVFQVAQQITPEALSGTIKPPIVN